MKVNKIINGYVVQVFDTEAEECEGQEFMIADADGKNVEWVATDTGESTKEPENSLKMYHPMNMVQPEEIPTCLGD